MLAVPAESSERAETHGAPMVTGRGLSRQGGSRPTYSPLTGSSVAGTVKGIPLPLHDDVRLRNWTGDPKQTWSDHLLAEGTASRISSAFGVVMVTVLAAPLVASNRVGVRVDRNVERRVEDPRAIEWDAYR